MASIFGYNTKGEYSWNIGKFFASRFVCPKNGILNSISVYLFNDSGSTQKFQIGIYNDVSGTIGKRLISTISVSILDGFDDWRTIIIPAFLNLGSVYWITVQLENSGAPVYIYYDPGDEEQQAYKEDWDFGTWPDNPVGLTYSANKISIYATYTFVPVSPYNWGFLSKNQIDPERVEAAIDRIIAEHNDDEQAHIGESRSLDQHKLSDVIDHVVASIIADKIKDGEVTNPKIIVGARAYTAVVDPSGDYDYTDIQEAIDYAHALGGGSILVLPGTYNLTDHITLYENISLIGFDRDSVILDFQSNAKSVKAIGEDSPYYTGNASVSYGSTAVTGGGGANWDSGMIGKYISLKQAWYKIIAVTDATHLTIKTSYKGPTISGYGYAIANHYYGIIIKDLTILNSGTYDVAYNNGIEFDYVMNSVIQDCIIKRKRFGIAIGRSNEIYVSNNIIKEVSRDGIYLYAGCHATVTKNKIIGCRSGMYIGNIFGCYIVGNRIAHTEQYGITIVYAEHNTIVGNFLHSIGNSGSGNRNGIILDANARYNKIIGNTFMGAVEDGIKLYDYEEGSNNYIRYNIIEGNVINDNGGWGVNIAHANDEKNIIISNQIRDNTSGAINDLGTDSEIAHNIIT